MCKFQNAINNGATSMRLYRSMKEDHTGFPMLGIGGRFLGVRPGNVSPADVSAILSTDLVIPGTGGMSVAPDDPLYLERYRRPRGLGGTGSDPVWYIEMDDLGPDLQFDATSPVTASPMFTRTLPWLIGLIHSFTSTS